MVQLHHQISNIIKHQHSIYPISTIPPTHISQPKTQDLTLQFLNKMSTKPSLILPVLFLILSLISSSSSASSSTNVSAYEVLEDYKFPIGLLPNGVLGYELNSTNGAFKAYLSNSTCTFSIDSYELKYKPTVSGYISTDKLSSLSGVYVKVWWFWLRIVKVTRDDDELEFSVGIGSAKFPVSNFDECPTCGCGFECDSVIKKMRKKIRLKGLVGSY